MWHWGGGNRTVEISDSDDAEQQFADALADQSVTEIVIAHQTLVMRPALFHEHGAGRANGLLPIARDVLVRSAAANAPAAIDWGMMDATLELKAGRRMEYGPGTGADFLRGKGPTSLLLFNRAVWLRSVCLPFADRASIGLVGSVRATAAAGGGGAADPNVAAGALRLLPETCLNGTCYQENAVGIARAFVLVVPGSEELGGVAGSPGGAAEAGMPGDDRFLWELRDSTRLCKHTVSEACLEVSSANACYDETYLEVISSEADAADAAGGGPPAGVIAAPIAVGGAAALAVAVGAPLALLARRRRRRREREAEVAAGCASQRGSHESDYCQAWSLLGAPGGNGPGGTWQLMARHSAPEFGGEGDAGQQLLDHVALGVLLGAGSFGRVYKGRWQGRDVAVKVMIHDASVARSVAREIDLVMSFKHPNIVQAYHCNGAHSPHTSDNGFEPGAGDVYTVTSQPTGTPAGASSLQPAPSAATCAEDGSSLQTPAPDSSIGLTRSGGALLTSGGAAAAPGCSAGPLFSGASGGGASCAGASGSGLFGVAGSTAMVRPRGLGGGLAGGGGAAAAAAAAAAPPARPALQGGLAPHTHHHAAAPPALGAVQERSLSSLSRGSGAGRPGGGAQGNSATNQSLIDAIATATSSRSTRTSSSHAFAGPEPAAGAGRGAGDGGGGGGSGAAAQDLWGGPEVPTSQTGTSSAAAAAAAAAAGVIAAPPGASAAALAAAAPGAPAPRPGGPPGSPRGAARVGPGAGGGGGSGRGGGGGGAGGTATSVRGEAQTWLVLEYCDRGNLADVVHTGLLHGGAPPPAPAGGGMWRRSGGDDGAPGGEGGASREGDQAPPPGGGSGSGSSGRGGGRGAAREFAVDLPLALRMLLDLARGMAYLHARNVVHADLKSQNVLLTSAPGTPAGVTAKISDFGLSKALALDQTHVTTHSLGTISHMPPELFKTGRMSPAGDVYAFGILVWEVLTGRGAFSGMHYAEVIEAVAIRGARPPLPSSTPPELAALMSSCWQPDPTKRPGFDALAACFELLLRGYEPESTSGSTVSGPHSAPAAGFIAGGGGGGGVASRSHAGVAAAGCSAPVNSGAGAGAARRARGGAPRAPPLGHPALQRQVVQIMSEGNAFPAPPSPPPPPRPPPAAARPRRASSAQPGAPAGTSSPGSSGAQRQPLEQSSFVQDL
ncbi:MAG: hypothetical protein J3K34DRAFT_477631 [Monoraphidium minutum]|nr:MAG: hypothetical protein J3K34DRAFT_477631 [Monoraphidium minutum]